MLCQLPETHELLKKTCYDFVENEVKVIAPVIDREHRYPGDLVSISCQIQEIMNKHLTYCLYDVKLHFPMRQSLVLCGSEA